MKRLVHVASALLALSAATAGAQEESETARSAATVPERFLGAWAYLPIGDIQGPYVPTFVSSVTGLGGYTLDVDLETDRLDLQLRDLDYLAVVQRFDAQFAFLDRFAIRFSGIGEGVIPDTRDSALAVAVNGQWGVGGGLVGQLLKKDQYALALYAEYAFVQRAIVTPATTAGEIVDERRLERLFDRRDVNRLEGGPTAALALSPWLGLVGEVAWASEWQSGDDVGDPERTLDFIELRGAISANFWKERVPLGASVFWRQRIPIDEDNPVDFNRRYGGGIFYTGRPSLDFGIEYSREEEEREPGSLLLRTERHYLAPRIRGYF